MNSDESVDFLVQLSCCLSMVGSCLVAVTWAYPKTNRHKRGRILLLWLSLSDFLSSSAYFVQSFNTSGDDTYCQVTALLGIYFPVASFLWTDCIAYFLYLVVSKRTSPEPYEWTALLRIFHCVVWSISALVMVLVLAFDRAGYANDDDESGSGDNTGGWCWIKADTAEDRFMWELIGGKLVEWTSCLIILPYLYASVAWKLNLVEGGDARRAPAGASTPGRSSIGTHLQPQHSNKDTEHIYGRNSLQESSISRPHPIATQTSLSATTCNQSDTNSDIPALESLESLHDLSDLSHNAFVDSMHRERDKPMLNAVGSEEVQVGNPNRKPPEDQLQHRNHPGIGYTYDDENTNTGSYNDSCRSLPTNENDYNGANNREYYNHGRDVHRCDPDTTMDSTGNHKDTERNAGYFSKFYLKLAAVPIVILVIRFWGSLRIILQYACAHQSDTTAYSNRDDFLHAMQAFFDPSQGFFNALLFVAFSPEERSNVGMFFVRACELVVCGGSKGSCRSSSSYSSGAAGARARYRQLKLEEEEEEEEEDDDDDDEADNDGDNSEDKKKDDNSDNNNYGGHNGTTSLGNTKALSNRTGDRGLLARLLGRKANNNNTNNTNNKEIPSPMHHNHHHHHQQQQQHRKQFPHHAPPPSTVVHAAATATATATAAVSDPMVTRRGSTGTAGSDSTANDGCGPRDKPLDSSSTAGHPSLLDNVSEYECDPNDAERVSDFSFDMGESDALPPAAAEP